MQIFNLFHLLIAELQVLYQRILDGDGAASTFAACAVKLHTASEAAANAIRVIFIILLSLHAVIGKSRSIVFQERMNMCE
jgi:hypothetical protein